MQASLSPLFKHRLPLQLRPLITGELYLATKLVAPAYVWKGDAFQVALHSSEGPPDRESIVQLIKDGVREVFVDRRDNDSIRQNLDQALVRVTRALSVGDPKDNGSRALKLMALSLDNLYRNPHDDQLLMKQFQSTQNMGKFLMENKKLQSTFFHDIAKENFHFTLLQPMLSSIMLLGFLQSTHMFHEREIETLFLTSYMKDVGIGIIPEDKYDMKGLTHDDQKLFARHSEFSYDILEGRVPLSRNQLNIIRHHHFLNDRLKFILSKQKRPTAHDDVAFGLESTLVAVADVLVAMTTPRPYRKSMSVFQSLELIRMMIADEYPQEFRAMVVYLKNFYKAA